MGDFGIAGLWLLLALSLVAAVAVASRQYVAGGSHPPKTGERRA